MLIDADVLVCFLKIVFFICFDHELMKRDDISIGQAFDWLQAESHDRTTIFYDLDVASTSRYTIDTSRLCGARNFQVASPEKLTELFRREYIA
jgi:hypothetical protein